MWAVKCEGLRKQYDHVVAVDGLDLEVAAGECFGLLGPNGAGKTTTTEMLEGLIEPDAGQIRILGETWGGANDQKLRERLGVALQETRLADRITVEESVRLFRSFYREGKSVAEVLEMLGLTEKRNTWVEKLSGGLRQRLALACALVSSPDLLFLDEPTTGLDPQARHRIWEVVETFKRAGGTVFLTTHYMEEAERLCDRVGIMEKGKLIALDTPQRLVDGLSAEQIIELASEPKLDESCLGQIPGVRSWQVKNGALVLRVDRLETTLPILLGETKRRGINIVSLTTHKTTLEDVYVHLTGKGLRNG